MTKIDEVIVMITVSLACNGIVTWALDCITNKHGLPTAQAWNKWIAIELLVVYTLANLIIFIPAVYRKRKAVRSLASRYDGSKDPEAILGDPPSTVKTGLTYIPLKELATVDM